MSALDIQWHYYTLASTYLDQFESSAEEEQILDAWEQALIDIEQDVMGLRDRADWVIKKRMLDSYLNQQGASWDQLADPVLETLHSRDLLYHDLSRDGLFEHFFHPDTLVTEAEIEQAQHNPPQYTRARVRGEAIKQARLFKQKVAVDRWHYIAIGGKKIALPDPLAFDCAQLDFDEAWWLKSIEHPDRAIRLRAINRLAWQPQPGALALLMQQAANDSDAQIRQAAVEALGHRADKQAQSVLIARLNDDNSQVRWAADEALEKVMRGVPTSDPTAIVQVEENEPLIRIIS